MVTPGGVHTPALVVLALTGGARASGNGPAHSATTRTLTARGETAAGHSEEYTWAPYGGAAKTLGPTERPDMGPTARAPHRISMVASHRAWEGSLGTLERGDLEPKMGHWIGG